MSLHPRTMKIRNLILVGVLCCVIFAISLFPVSLIRGTIAGMFQGTPLRLEQVGGTIWRGYALTQARSPIFSGPVVITWDLHGLNLLLGEVSLGLELEGNEFQLTGSAYWGLWGKGVKQLNGEAQAALLDQQLRQFGIRTSGLIKWEDLGANLSGKRFTSAGGNIYWHDGQVQAPAVGTREPLDFPPVNGQLREADGDLYLTVTEGKGNQLLGELGVLPEKGVGSVRVLQRVLSAAGMQQGNNDEKVLVNMQQPLPF